MENLFLSIFIIVSTMLSAQESGYKIGSKVSDFSLTNIDGNKVSLSSKDAKGYIVVFTCNHCPYAKLYEDRIIALDKNYASKGYPVIAINPNDPIRQPEDSYENMKKIAREKSYTFPYLFDETQEVTKAFGAAKTPHVYLLKKESGSFVVKYIGAIDDNPQNPSQAEEKYVEDAIEALMKGSNPSKTETKAVGCTIKWKQ